MGFHDFPEQDKKRTLGTVFYSFKKCQSILPDVADFVRCDFSTSTFILSLLTPVHSQTIFCQAGVNNTASTVVNTTISVQGTVLMHFLLLFYLKTSKYYFLDDISKDFKHFEIQSDFKTTTVVL